MIRAWVADPGIAWRILLTARLAEHPGSEDLHAALDALRRRQGWSATRPLVTGGDTTSLQRWLTGRQADPVVVGLADQDLVISAHHSAVDGLGLLAVLSALLDRPVRSDARGVADRSPAGGMARAVAGRLGEAALSPPARIAASGGDNAQADADVLVDLSVDGRPRTAPLVHAAARAVIAHNRAMGAGVRHVSVAVGAARPAAEEARIADRSALIRLRDVERLDGAGVAAALRSASLQPPVTAPGRGGARLVGAGLRLLAPRLGSTLLVSHLGTVSAQGVERLVFHPVTAGAGGVSLGAVQLGGGTVLSLRARAADWDTDGLQRLLRAVAAELC